MESATGPAKASSAPARRASRQRPVPVDRQLFCGRDDAGCPPEEHHRGSEEAVHEPAVACEQPRHQRADDDRRLAQRGDERDGEVSIAVRTST